MGKRSYKHLGIEQRRCIEHGLSEGKTLTAIGRQIGFDVSTVRREILRNRREDGSSHSRNKGKNNCAFLRTCKVRGLCGNGCDRRLCRCCDYPCEAMGCPEHKERSCEKVAGAPFACNGCQRYASCTLPRFRYSAESADAASRRRAREARSGIDLTEDEMVLLVDTVRDGRRKGRSIHHIFETNELPCSERSFYRHVEDETVPILSIELAKKVKYKKRKRKASCHGVGFYAGREYDDFLELPAEERACATEVDTVLGKRGDAPCILSLHRVDLRFQPYLRLPSKTKESVVGALDWLEECCTDPDTGRNCFPELFGLMLLDRGVGVRRHRGHGALVHRSLREEVRMLLRGPLQARPEGGMREEPRGAAEGAAEGHVPRGAGRGDARGYLLARELDGQEGVRECEPDQAGQARVPAVPAGQPGNPGDPRQGRRLGPGHPLPARIGPC